MKKNATEILKAEAIRFTELAAKSALKNLINNGNGDDARVAREHLIRAETFATAASLIAGKTP